MLSITNQCLQGEVRTAGSIYLASSVKGFQIPHSVSHPLLVLLCAVPHLCMKQHHEYITNMLVSTGSS
jgi:hypothetical protein